MQNLKKQLDKNYKVSYRVRQAKRAQLQAEHVEMCKKVRRIFSYDETHEMFNRLNKLAE